MTHCLLSLRTVYRFVTVLLLLYPVVGGSAQARQDVPKGEVLKFTFEQSKVFPGTTQEYWVYIPRQYTADKPACLYVNQDGIGWNAPNVFDQLIAAKEMPVTIGLFVMHGRVKAADPAKALDRFNRSYQYDGLGDNYAKFILDELIPEVEKQKASDGRAIRISREGNDHAIGGASSGAIAAFTAAWERPDAFSRVFSAIGTYVGLRGGDVYPTLIRKYEPRPIRVYLQDGSNDLNIYGGDWWMANQMMERALTFSGYEVNHIWGEGGHNGQQGTQVFPDAMRWLWKDWPQPVKNGPTRNGMMNDILAPGEGWQLVSEGYQFTEGPAVNKQGEVFFNDVVAAKTFKVGLDGKVTEFLANAQKPDGQAFGPDGRLYAVSRAKNGILAYDADGKAKTIVTGIPGNDIVVANNGNMYITAPASKPGEANNVWLVRPDGKKQIVDSGLKFPNGVTLSPDQTLLYVADFRSHWVYSYQVQPDGTLKHKQQYYWLHSPDTADDSGADGLRVDQVGRLYVATRMGIQVCDQAGRVNCIIPLPVKTISNMTFGGPDFTTLFVTAGDKVYKRKLKARGALGWDAPNRPAPPGL